MQFDPKLNPKAVEILRGLYEFKKALVESNRAFSKDEFLKGLKDIGMPSNAHFWAAILSCELPEQKCKLLTRVRKDAYVFAKPKDPIFWGDLQVIYNSYKRTVNKYSQTQKEKKTCAEKDEQLSLQIREAIDLLKSHGFEILAPVATLYAKM